MRDYVDLSQVTWRKSTRSQGMTDNCVEVGDLHHGIAVRDSKDRLGDVLIFSSEVWTAFAAHVKCGHHDL
jgi:hypothetical protein